MPQPPAAAPARPVEAVKITHFYAASPAVIQGQQVTLCYGVENGVAVRLTPPAVEPLKPTRRYCFIVKPDRATTYTLTARAADGYVETAQVSVKVR